MCDFSLYLDPYIKGPLVSGPSLHERVYVPPPFPSEQALQQVVVAEKLAQEVF